MSFRLVPLTSGTAPQIALHRPVLLIGRHLDCDVRIDSPKISRRHCCVAMAYDRVLIRDLGSKNGVRVNGRLVEEMRLHPGDELAIGPSLFRLEAEGDDQANLGAPISRPTQSSREAPAGSAPANVKGAASRPGTRPDSDIDLVPLDDF
jgi:pSer/pThr/pTyr-binding forkhead associated (FHA) protein